MNPPEHPTRRVARVAPTIAEFNALEERVNELESTCAALLEHVAELSGSLDVALGLRDQMLLSLLDAVFGNASETIEGEREQAPEEEAPAEAPADE